MKTTRPLHLIIYIALASLLAACSATDSADYRIGVSQCSEGRWRNKANQEMLAAQHLYEKHVRLTIANSFDDAALQARQIDSLAAAGIDLLVVAPNDDSPAINEAIARARRRGLPVVFFDRKTRTADYTAFIGGDNKEAGRQMGHYVAQLAAARASGGRRPLVLEITGAMSSTPARERHEGFEAVMAQSSAVDYHCERADWTSDAACRIAREWIAGGRRPDFIFCHNDGMATGVYKAVVETHTEGSIAILGIDGMPGEGLEYVQLGHQVGTYVYPTHGEQVVRLAIDILEGRPYKRDNVLQGLLVTPDNVELTARNATELMKQNADLVTIQDKLEDYFGLYYSQRRLSWALAAGCLAMLAALLATWRALRQTRLAIRQRQALNEEQAQFYAHTAPQPQRAFFETSADALPKARSQDELFAEQLNEAIRQKMHNPALKMDDLGEAMGLSRVQLYRRVKQITGLTPVELLRRMRLQQGYLLLCTTTKTVQEIAYEVGFGTPGYFSKCFRQQYGKYPMDVRSEQN